MKSVRLFLLLGPAVVGLAYLVFSSGHNPAAPIDDAIADPTQDLVIGEPIVFENLAIFPVSSKTPRMQDRFITLDEGLQAGTVEIIETGATTGGRGDPSGAASDPFASTPAVDPFGATAPEASDDDPTTADAAPAPNRGNSVNELMVVNRSEKPLYLMPGEIIIGGAQDRTIGEELVVAPDGKPVALDVFCVEHGRWGGRTEAAYAGLLAPIAADEGAASQPSELSSLRPVSEVAEIANSGKFIGSYGSLNKQARMAVQSGEGQGKVWQEVANVNALGGVETASGTFAENYADTESVERLKPYITRIQTPIDETANIVGVIVAVNGKVESMDVFESTPLFRKLWPKLLKGYALDASNAEMNEQPMRAASCDDALSFLRETAKSQVTKTDSEGALASSRGESDRVLLFSAHERQQRMSGDRSTADAGYGGAVMGGGMGGGMDGGAFGGAIHSSGFSK